MCSGTVSSAAESERERSVSCNSIVRVCNNRKEGFMYNWRVWSCTLGGAAIVTHKLGVWSCIIGGVVMYNRRCGLV